MVSQMVFHQHNVWFYQGPKVIIQRHDWMKSFFGWLWELLPEKNIKKQGIGWVRKTYSVVVSIPKNRFIGYTCCFWDTHRKSFKWWRESIVVHRLTGKKWEYQRSLPVGNGVGKWVDQFTLSKLGYNEMLMSCLSSLARMEHQSFNDCIYIYIL